MKVKSKFHKKKKATKTKVSKNYIARIGKDWIFETTTNTK